MVETDFTFEVDISALFPLFGKRFTKLLESERHAQSVEQATSDFTTLVSPVLLWERFRIETFREHSVILSNGIEIGGGPVVQVIECAEEVITGICSIGHKMEEQSKEALKSGKSIYGMLLDALGSWGVDSIKEQFYCRMQHDLKQNESFRTSTLLSPGESEWDITEQGKIFHLLEENPLDFGMNITESNMLVPLKSLSFLFGTGRNKMGSEKESSCAFCTMGKTCRHRALRK